MTNLRLLTALLCTLSRSEGFLLEPDPAEKCYQSLGCFSNAPPFDTRERSQNFLPEDLAAIGTRFLLFTRDNWNSTEENTLSVSDADSAVLTRLSNTSQVKVIVHGFLHSAREQWVHDMVHELLKHDDMDVIAVDWEKGAQLPYGQAASNARVVGAQVAQLVDFLVQQGGILTDRVHIIGHSLGAHVAGYAGERITRLGRITGLDPSSPFFDGTPAQVRLDPSDASFVDVIHTDASSLLMLGMGASDIMGHVDFFPNGGSNQPGCDQDLISKIAHTAWTAATIGTYAAEGAVACSHQRAIDLFTESINTPCPFTAYPCVSADEFKKGNCLTCPGSGCSRLGYHADEMPGRGTLYLNTQDSTSFCSYHYKISLTSENAVDGIISVELQGEKGRTSAVALTQANEIVNAGNTVSHLLTTRQDIGALSGMGVTYQKTHTLLVHLLYADTWSLRAATAFSGETQQRAVFCAGGQAVPDGSTSVFNIAGHCQ